MGALDRVRAPPPMQRALPARTEGPIKCDVPENRSGRVRHGTEVLDDPSVRYQQMAKIVRARKRDHRKVRTAASADSMTTSASASISGSVGAKHQWRRDMGHLDVYRAKTTSGGTRSL